MDLESADDRSCANASFRAMKFLLRDLNSLTCGICLFDSLGSSEKEASLLIMIFIRKLNSFDCAFFTSSLNAVEGESGKFRKPSAPPDVMFRFGQNFFW